MRSGKIKAPSTPNISSEELLQAQLKMVQEWENETGKKSSTADFILKRLKEPMTQSDFLWEEGYGMTVSEALDDPELLAELPDWFQDLPKGESPGLWN
jgi:hypothetical protein